MRVGATAAFALLSLPFVAVTAEEAAPSVDEKTDEKTKPYVAPNVEDLHWAETFDGDVWSRWSHSNKEKFNGKFTVETRKKEALVGDVGLLVPEAAKHYGISTQFPAIEGQKDVPFVVQFEVAFQDGMSCGGSYLKLFDSQGKHASEFDNETPFVIMFGPDRCGATDKIHFILQHKNPKTGKWEEKHSKETATSPHDQRTHLYGLVLNSDNSYEILIDGEVKASGNLLSSMEPAVNPPKKDR
jgi:calnexin